MSEVGIDISKYVDPNGKYLREADELLKKKDYAQASEKLWGATAEMIKAVAAKRGLVLGTHRSIAEFVNGLDREYPDWKLADKYAHSNSLHINFYEDWLPPELVEKSSVAVKEMMALLRKLL